MNVFIISMILLVFVCVGIVVVTEIRMKNLKKSINKKLAGTIVFNYDEESGGIPDMYTCFDCDNIEEITKEKYLMFKVVIKK